MKFLEIEQTPKTPYILFDGRIGLLKIEGRCIPEDAKEFFKDLQESLDEYEKDPKEIFNLIVNLEYFNTTTSRELMAIFYHLPKFPSKVLWCHEKNDSDMIEIGEDFEQILKTVPFTFQIIER
jgi:hypothetical protein